jgi:hypothetical protein
MSDIAVFAPRCPNKKQRNAIENANALISVLAIGEMLILSGEQIAIEKPVQVGVSDAVIFDISATLSRVPCVHRNSVYAARICCKRVQGCLGDIC